VAGGAHGDARTAIAESVIHHYGRAAFLSRLSDPFWFQAFGHGDGMDWHSSGIHDVGDGALKRGLNPRADELGLYICGGRGEQSRRNPGRAPPPSPMHECGRRGARAHEPADGAHRPTTDRRRLPRSTCIRSS